VRPAPLLLLLMTAPAAAAPVDDFIRAEMDNRHIPGLSLTVLKDGKVLATKNYGLANLEADTPVTSRTVFKIASLSKTFIADAILLLAQEGKLALDDRAAKFLSDAPESWQGITIRQLLGHVSGIVRDPPDYHPYETQGPMEVIRSAYTLPLASAPGEKYLYSNIGYYILAEIISRTSGQSWDAYIAAHFLAPAGMTATRLTTREIVPNRAAGYSWRGDRYFNAEEWAAVRPSGAFLSTPEDMARWDQFQRSPRFPLTAESRTLAITSPRLRDGSSSNYGFGWMVDNFLDQARIHHDGVFPGFRSDYEKFGGGLSVILLTNAENGGVERMAIKVAGFFDPALVPPRFTLTIRAPVATRAGTETAITVSATADRTASGSLFEMEIWGADNKPVFKSQKADQDFGAGESRRLSFGWTPKSAGTYSVSVGAYGPHYVPDYAWAEKAATILVVQ
jgi:CubicO group peptidase (beta-lactamase class C family)